MASLPSFFKSTRTRQFEYKPMYYNEREEALAQRIKNIEGEEKGIYNREGLRERMSTQWSRKDVRKSYNKRSNLIIIALVAVLAAAAYFYLYR